MCHKTQKFPAFETGDELFRRFFAWCSSIGSHMSQQRNAAGTLILLVLHVKSLLLRNLREIIAYRWCFRR